MHLADASCALEILYSELLAVPGCLHLMAYFSCTGAHMPALLASTACVAAGLGQAAQLGHGEKRSGRQECSPLGFALCILRLPSTGPVLPVQAWIPSAKRLLICCWAPATPPSRRCATPACHLLVLPLPAGAMLFEGLYYELTGLFLQIQLKILKP